MVLYRLFVAVRVFVVVQVVVVIVVVVVMRNLGSISSHIFCSCVSVDRSIE